MQANYGASDQNPSPGSSTEEGTLNSHNAVYHGTNIVGSQVDYQQAVVVNNVTANVIEGTSLLVSYHSGNVTPTQLTAAAVGGLVHGYNTSPVVSKEDAEKYINNGLEEEKDNFTSDI